MSVGAVPVASEIPGGALTPEQLALAAVPPPVAFPDNPVDQALADNSQLSQNPPTVVPKTPEELAAANAADSQKLGEERVRTAEGKSALDTQLAQEKVRFQSEYQTHLQRLLDQQELHRQAAESHVADLRAKAETEPFHTSFMDSRATGQKVAIALGLLVGGVSWNPNHVNRGAQMLDTAMKNHEALQKQKHAELWKAVDEAEEGTKDLNASQLRELAVFNAREGARWDAIAGNLGALIAANRGRNDVSEAKRISLEANEKASQYWQNSVHSAATAQHLEQQDKERARHDLEIEKLRAKKLAGGGSGGGAGGSKLQESAIKLREEIEKAKSENKPLTDAQIARRAFDLKIPEVAKAGRISLKTIMDDIGKSVNAETKSDTLSIKHEEALDARTVRWNGKEYLAPRANQVKDIAKDIANSEKYQDLIREVANDIRKNGFIVDPGGPDNPVTGKGKRRMSIMAELQALGRQISGLQATDAGTKLEGQMIGHAGVGIKPGTASPDALTELGARAMKLINTKFGAMLTPREKATAQGGGESSKWIAVPSYLRDNPKLKGKSEILVNASNDILSAR